MGNHPKRGKPGGIEEYRAQLRAQADKGWAKTRLEQVEAEKMKPGTTFAKDLRGAWHIASATYPNTADTACGREGLRCDFFAWHAKGRLGEVASDIRPERCPKCFPSPSPDPGPKE